MSVDRDRIARALGASRTLPVQTKAAQGPLGLLQLRAEIAARLHSSGGRPTDPRWTLKRVVPFGSGSWQDLEHFASRLSEAGRSVSPAQLAAMLVERGLGELQRAEAEGGDDAIRSATANSTRRRAS